MSVITIPKPHREKLGDEATEALVKVNRVVQDESEQDPISKNFFERRLSEKIGKLRNEMSENKSELLKWMSIFWVSQLSALFVFLKFIR